jgi:phosphoribosylglycinamide formyltransferase 1
MARRRVAVLISGGGSNLQALINHAAQPGSGVEIILAVSNEPRAYGLERARRASIAAHAVDHRDFVDQAAFEAAIDERLRAHDIELVCLAGFMRILTPEFVLRWQDRLLNIHPSLLPAFRGLDTHARALAAGVRIHGCTVHLVRRELDNGPILVQAVVPVLADDDPTRLAARVLEAEHLCYPAALEGLASGTLTIAGGRVTGAGRRLILHPSLVEA